MSDNPNPNREATASIRGYLYQFDASIFALLKAQPDEEFTIEGIEDFDHFSTDQTVLHSQIKYYSSKGLTNATIRDTILPMLESFLAMDAAPRSTKKFKIYGHFKGECVGELRLDLDRLKGLLVRRSKKLNGEGKPILDGEGKQVWVTTDLKQELGASDSDLKDFCSRLEIQISEEFEKHRLIIIDALREKFGVTRKEAELSLYPTALAKLSDLAIGQNAKSRTTTSKAFIQSVKISPVVYSAWALREEGENTYCKKIRAQHFSQLNIDNSDRFFIFRLPATDSTSDVFDLINHVIAKWSSHRIKSKPNKERFAPFFYIPEMTTEELVIIKQNLISNGHEINDGFAFNGAKFNASKLVSGQSKSYPVSARFVSNEAEFAAALGAARQKKVIVQVHAGEFEPVDCVATQVAIQVSNAAMAKKIL